ncbi:hypothetical protein MHYP_G00036920 [Metynnis hypsauchen]
MKQLVMTFLITCCFAVSSTLRHKSWRDNDILSVNDGDYAESAGCVPKGSDGSEYRGTVSVTARGNRCLRWSRIRSLERIYASRGLGHHNYCRNPDNSLMPWCGVKRGMRIVREFCNIPQCEAKPDQIPEEPNGSYQDTETTCGEQSLNVLSKIIGGYRSPIESQPWVASIFRKKGGFKCGGTLIAPCWVLTAAHCFLYSQRKEDYTVYLGKNALNETDPSKEQMFTVTKLMIHEGYENENYNNDIALLQIVNSKGQCAQRTRSVRTVCLPPAKQMIPYGGACKIAGYGRVSLSSQFTYSQYLKETYVNAISQIACDRDYYRESEIPVTDNMFCAASPTWKEDACQGDSGGPLVYEQNGRMFLFGIISWGDECATESKPGVYTKVTNYNKWIAERTGLYSFTTGIMYPQKD